MKVGIISDTHGILREEVVGHLEGCDLIFHAGDVGGKEIIEALQKIAPTVVVKGNNDKDEWSRSLEKRVLGEIEGVRYLIVHDKKDIPPNIEEIDMVVFGHSHKFYEEIIEKVCYLNPGSCGRRRFSLPLTMAIAEIKEGKVCTKKILLNE